MTKKKRWKILQVGKFYPIQGGVEKVMYDLLLGLSERQIECDMLCAGEKGEDRVIRLNPYARLFVCKTWFKYAATMISPSMIYRLRKIAGQYDLIHVHHPDPMACLALFVSGYKGKVVLHWHSDILRQQVLLRFYRPLQNWLLRRADKVVETSPVYLSESPSRQWLKGKLSCLPIGVEPMRPVPETIEAIQQRYENRNIVFSLGRLIPYKGYQHLIAAAQYLDDNYIILIGGTGPLKDELQKEIDTLHVNDKVKLLGRIDEEKLSSYYGACKVFCLSSVQRTEAFGIVQIEAMSCGKPVVATRIPRSGVAWVNQHGFSGINVAPGNPEEIAKAILKITADETYNQYAENAKRRYDEFFTKERMIAQCLSIYESAFK